MLRNQSWWFDPIDLAHWRVAERRKRNQTATRPICHFVILFYTGYSQNKSLKIVNSIYRINRTIVITRIYQDRKLNS